MDQSPLGAVPSGTVPMPAMMVKVFFMVVSAHEATYITLLYITITKMNANGAPSSRANDENQSAPREYF